MPKRKKVHSKWRTPGDKKFEIWSEGFNTQGATAQAHIIHDGIFAHSFDSAVSIYEITCHDEKIKPVKHQNGYWTIWGCRLFDNEADARKAFG
jgi:hypothetical protein